MAHSHPVIDRDNHFIIDPITRAVTNAESKKTILMQNDHNSERFTFEIDKLVEGHDMTKCNKVEVHYTNEDSNKKNKNAGVYEVTDMQVSTDNADKLIFSWLVSENATLYAGSLKFLIVFSCVEKGEVTYRWNTNVNTSITISKGMNNGEAVEGSYPDVLTQWKEQLFAAMYGMETTHVGPTEPESYPYIWFDTSQYMGSDEPYIGVLTIKDADGNKHVLYPFAKLAGTDGASLEVRLNEAIDNVEKAMDDTIKVVDKAISEFSTSKIGVDKISDNLETLDEGYVLSARQGYELKRLANTKATTADFAATLLADGWSDSSPYTQTVAVEGIAYTDKPFVDISMTDVEDTALMTESWNFVRMITADDNSITAYAYDDKPTIDMTINIKVVR